MSQFLVPPEYCLILKALQETRTLREAATLLSVDPAQLSRKLSQISSEHDFLLKAGNRWVLNEKGRRLVQWVDESAGRQRSLLDERAFLRISSFGWLAEQMLIPNLDRLGRMTENRFLWKIQIASSDLDQELISGRTDAVISCHPPHDPLIAHKAIAPDAWYVIAPAAWEKRIKGLKDQALIDFLNEKPFLRLVALNPDQMLGFSPQTDAEASFDSVVGVRTAVASGLGWGCVPSLSIASHLKRNEVIRLPIGSHSQGHLSVWWLRSRKDMQSHSRFFSKWLHRCLQMK